MMRLEVSMRRETMNSEGVKGIIKVLQLSSKGKSWWKTAEAHPPVRSAIGREGSGPAWGRSAGVPSCRVPL